MNISALLTSSGINTAVCVVLFSLYSILRKQPSLVSVYFGQKLSQVRSKRNDPLWFQRFIPSASWIVKSWEASEEELLAIGGLDAVVFLRAVVFSIRVFSVASVICLFLVLPLNYFGKEMDHKHIRNEQLSVFTIENVKEGSRWLWAHCLALYVISSCACILLYFEYKSVTKMRLAYIAASRSQINHFTVLVRAIPWSREGSYSVRVAKFFTDYYSSSYLSHQMIYKSGAMQKLMTDAEKIYNVLKSNTVEQHYGSRLLRCGFCGGTSTSFKILSPEPENVRTTSLHDGPDLGKKECGAALVFFRTRYAALVASEALQQPNPMTWVTDLAPEPSDIYWSNLYVPYRIFWIRKIAILVAFILFVTFFLIPVVFTQSLVHLDKLEKVFPFIKGITERKFMKQLITGYLPSVILMIFLSIVPPIMMVFSTLEGSISRSGRKRSSCIKVLYFIIWNVFFANILTEAAIDHYQVSIMKLGDPKTIPNQLAKAVPSTATFFVTYVLTSGWASLSFELIQPFPLLCNSFYRFILRNKDDTSYGSYTFPYHTEVPRVLLFGLLGFTCSVLAPLILPFLLVYFFLAYLVYRNQILDVYVTRYQSGGLYWPIIHNTTIFSLVLTQIISLGVFGIKHSPIASSFTIPLIICTLLFNEYCRQRFHPIFKKTPSKTIIDMDREDEHSGRMEEIHHQLLSAYCQIKSESKSSGKSLELNCPETEVNDKETGDISRPEDPEAPVNTSAQPP
ncbi:CSC1-like protein RXW8 isoform X1 [Olea europaea var. sylvestris]|uniref:CSC1-like protein RXW8 isoform X1 n=2 Tax=Olea europaea var. sylvestris TaxID=158386 RepID=UPI000C1CE817|nr:CSC1-like protein RXW8 isoform X1 [Olea europaea var. sylvestris]XP_022849683.1 CSC1-like protein RXW8 isoform X1 [Olea europaea var. sylvestris]XP_022849684.1 CSC1-like protein RXW8 isoform X1 [Olea europaea var. sylvestris]XP_022849685.1 CSC1-like protein RXW8 isoform X1 [Olea europaea var. sylvestris]XP_022849686.1 CSC1-like protein RXW8 isoform X1 [Olea europaea var. sylvestris]